ncbi:MAG: DEAD/DEAH box helicase [Bacteroidota bacterium]
MSKTTKNQKSILNKMRIEKLNPMQEEAHLAIHSSPDVVLLSPTGTGKTLAFLLPIIAELDSNCTEIQVLILVPSRELAIQIEQVTREMGTGYKTNAVYGGRSGSKDKLEIKHRPAILIGTPGRVADHLRRENFSADNIKTLVLDEFDKSLEVGFEKEMIEIVDNLPNLKKRILTSATQDRKIPAFVGLTAPIYINYLDKEITELKIKTILSPSKDKRETLVKLLAHIGNQPGIIFCNFKDTIQWLSDFLTEKNISHGNFYGGLEQQDRERALIKFRNGTHQLIIATDLAARGIDITELKFIIHYQLPPREKEFTHRNGRTARMHNDGTAYVLQWENENLPDFIRNSEIEILKEQPTPTTSNWKTLFISGGRKDKISKGDIAGLFLKQAKLDKEQLGTIELKTDCAFVSVRESQVDHIIKTINNTKLKKKKIRVSLI